MNLAAALQRLRRLKPQLAERFGVTGLAVFGSYAREDQSPGSDLDLLVDFAQPPSLFDLARMDSMLEEALGVRVDTVSRDSLNPRYAPYILSELRAV